VFWSLPTQCCDAAGSCRVDQQRGEPLHPAVDGDVIHIDSAPGQQFHDVAEREPVPPVQRTATMITSAGNRNPTKPDLGADTGQGDGASAQPAGVGDPPTKRCLEGSSPCATRPVILCRPAS
jgi:hypothetical protein